MPELTEVKIMSDFINQTSIKRFIKAYHVAKGNMPDIYYDNPFTIKSTSNGKELIVDMITNVGITPIYIFMGMSGNWKFVPTSEWNNTKFVRLRMDTDDGHSLLLYGGYMGPKYSVGKPFGGTKRGPDPTKDFENFKNNINSNLHKKVFDKPICEVLLNQEYFNGIGNYIRSTILYYADVNPFETGRESIHKNPKILDLCRDVPLKSYEFNGGQLRDWQNPFDVDSTQFEDWVFYQKGLSCKDKTGRTFWFDNRWKEYCPYQIKSLK